MVFIVFPPVIFITLIGNFVIDSLVIVACFHMFKLIDTQGNLKTFYKKSIMKVWIFGFLADIIGAAILFILSTLGDPLGLPNGLIIGINYDPFGHPGAVLVIAFSMLIAGFFILVFNNKFTFGKQIEEKRLRLKIAITVAIVTIPWTFLLPTKWFYHGF